MDKQIAISSCRGLTDIRESVFRMLDGFDHLFQAGPGKVLLKPNFNANMNALTGNTTDLRVLASVIEYLKQRGYSNIVIGEGANSIYYRNNISVISRLKIDRLAEYYGVRLIDFNYSEPAYIEFENGIKAGVAREVFESDMIINIPKLKTHFEAGMSVCLKNLVGCLVGQDNKRKAHKSLARNILHLNERIKPQLHIVDGLIAMEGFGPTRGTPVHTGLVIAGMDPYLIDLCCAKIAMFDYRKVTTLKAAEEAGLLNKAHHKAVASLDLRQYQKRFLPPKAGFLAQLVHSPKRQKYFMAIRRTSLFNYICSTQLGGKILFLTGIRQDNVIKEELLFEGLSLKRNLCKGGCRKCADYCPIGLALPEQINEAKNGCIECLYCFLVCPTNAVEFKGRLGFMTEQLRQYDKITREVT